MTGVRVGLFLPDGQPLTGGPEQLHAMLARVAGEGVDHICVGYYASSWGGLGRPDHCDLDARRPAELRGVRRALPAVVAPSGSGRLAARYARAACSWPRPSLGVGIGGEDPTSATGFAGYTSSQSPLLTWGITLDGVSETGPSCAAKRHLRRWMGMGSSAHDADHEKPLGAENRHTSRPAPGINPSE